MSTKPALDSPARRPKNRKAHIALAAAELFCEHGYHRVGIDDIARAVGITGPAVYRHFPNKYAMLAAATRDLAEAVLTATEPSDPDLAPRNRLDEILDALARLAIQRRRVGGLYQWEGRYLEPADRAQLGADIRLLIDRIAQPLGDLRPQLEPASARLLARGVLSVMGSLSTHRAAIAHGKAHALLVAAGWRLLLGDVGGLVPSVADLTPQALEAGLGLRPRRETILAEALRLFHARGYHAVSMEDIAASSGTRASSLYRYFPGKAELLAAAYYRAADRVAVATAEALATATDPAEALARLVDSYVDLVFGQSDLVSVYQAEQTNLPAMDRHELRKVQRQHVEEWVRVLDRLHPQLTQAECRILAHAALNLVSDLGRYTRFDRAADRRVAGLALTVLK